MCQSDGLIGGSSNVLACEFVDWNSNGVCYVVGNQKSCEAKDKDSSISLLKTL